MSSAWAHPATTPDEQGGHIHRRLDLLLAGTACVALSPVIGLIALAVRLDSRGAATYRGVRVGYRGRAFRMLKFRKMHDSAAGSPLTAADDTRFTRMGRILSRAKLDELPQLVNVLSGEMAIVGPRPEHPQFVRARLAEFAPALAVPPGITGLSQVAFRDEFVHLVAGAEEESYLESILPIKLRLDRWYAEHRSTALDMRIIWWTAAALLTRRTPRAAERIISRALEAD
jgi:lipopolysaccharide/colanic/teichoic acid biosynthesis glycosyltransferase